MSLPTIAVAGPTGDLGGRIVRALVSRGAAVRALVRPDAVTGEKDAARALGADVVAADPADRGQLVAALRGADCVVSALNGLTNVILGRQVALLEAAVEAGVPRFIPSAFSLDYTGTRPGLNRNLDLRREFEGIADRASIQVTSIFNGAFMDMLGEEVPFIQPRLHRVLYWRSADQLLDWTTKDDVAAFTAAAAMDPDSPRYLRVAGDTVSVRQLAQILTRISGARYRPIYVGGLGVLGVMIRMGRLFAPGENETFPVWQGMQYSRDMFSGDGKLDPLDNARYGDLGLTSVETYLRGKGGW